MLSYIRLFSKPSIFSSSKAPLNEQSMQMSLEELIKLRHYALRNPSAYIKEHVASHGLFSSKVKGRGMDYEESRHYGIGDEIRHLDWRVTARTGKPHTKIFKEDLEKHVVIYIDFNKSLYFGTQNTLKASLAVKLAALTAWQHHQAGHCVSTLIQQRHRPSFIQARQTKLLTSIFQAWLHIHNQQDENFFSPEELLFAVKRFIPKNSLLIYISDFPDLQPIDKILKVLHHHYRFELLHVYDTLERSLPSSGIFTVANDTGSLVQLNCFSKTLQQAYQEDFLNKIQLLKQFSLHYPCVLKTFETKSGIF